MAFPNSLTYNFDDIVSATLARVRPKMADTFFEAIPILNFMLSGGRVEVCEGGRHIEERLLYADNNTVGPYRRYDELTAQPTESITVATYNWRQYSGAIMFDGYEEAINSGEAQVIDLVKHNVKVLEMSFRDKMAQDLFAATSAKDLNMQILGFEQLIESNVSGSQDDVVGGIDKATYSWWENQYESVDYGTKIGAGDSRPIYSALTRMTNNTSRNGLVAPSDQAIVMSQTLYEQFELEHAIGVGTSLEGAFRYMPKDQASMNIGWTGEFRFKGRPVMWDDKVAGTVSATTDSQDGHVCYVLSLPFLSFKIHKNRNFAMTPFRTPHNQDARVAYMLWMGNLICNNMRHQGKIVFDDVGSVT